MNEELLVSRCIGCGVAFKYSSEAKAYLPLNPATYVWRECCPPLPVPRIGPPGPDWEKKTD